MLNAQYDNVTHQVVTKSSCRVHHHQAAVQNIIADENDFQFEVIVFQVVVAEKVIAQVKLLVIPAHSVRLHFIHKAALQANVQVYQLKLKSITSVVAVRVTQICIEAFTKSIYLLDAVVQ